MDGNIRRGTDIVKGTLSEARAVLFGRVYNVRSWFPTAPLKLLGRAPHFPLVARSGNSSDTAVVGE
jgi:hypothetical protein